MAAASATGIAKDIKPALNRQVADNAISTGRFRFDALKDEERTIGILLGRQIEHQ
jgi:hypothetical protein